MLDLARLLVSAPSCAHRSRNYYCRASVADAVAYREDGLRPSTRLNESQKIVTTLL